MELAPASAYFFQEEPPRDEKAAAQFLNKKSCTLLKELGLVFEQIEPFVTDSIQSTIEKFLAQKELKLKAVAQPLRVALTGNTASPGIYELLALLGKERVQKRLAAATT